MVMYLSEWHQQVYTQMDFHLSERYDLYIVSNCQRGYICLLYTSIPYHTDIMERFDGIDLDAAGKVAGNGFYYLMGDIARCLLYTSRCV